MKTMVITGTSRGLGLTIARTLYSCNDLNIATICRRGTYCTDERTFNFQGDITNSKDGISFINEVLKKFGQIDVLINNAGIVNLKSYLEYTPLDYAEIFSVNVAAPFFLSQLCIQQMLLQKAGGYIINIGSTRAITGAPDKSLYSMSKFALRSMTQCINAEFNCRNIYSTIICPGKITSENIYDIINTIVFLIKNNIKTIPEIIIGGKL
jgi:meso-butanediol dehydrogenase/(S,S)-butanediol dehydrogenase/diacetyl reductase